MKAIKSDWLLVGIMVVSVILTVDAVFMVKSFPATTLVSVMAIVSILYLYIASKSRGTAVSVEDVLIDGVIVTLHSFNSYGTRGLSICFIEVEQKYLLVIAKLEGFAKDGYQYRVQGGSLLNIKEFTK